MTIRSQSKEEEGQQLVPRQLFHPWMARSRDSIYLVRLIPGFPSLQSSSQPPRKLEKLISFIQKYKETGFNDALIIAKEIASEMKVEPVFYEKRTIRKIKHFDDSDNEEELAQSALESFKISYFLYIIDQTLSSLQSRFEQSKKYEEEFGFLFKLEKLKFTDNKNLMNYCMKLESMLKVGDDFDIIGYDLFYGLATLKELYQKRPKEQLMY
ncbi:hypothetical protein ACLB2K_019631 [Fragaria x ananassa]